MRRAIPWLGLFLLTISFVCVVRQPAPTHPTSAPLKPALPRERPLVVVLDPGHGGQDSGAMCGTLTEKDLTLDVALRVELLLRAEGYTTVLTRDDDQYLSLEERAAVGNREENSLFVSIHFNDEPRATVSGVETYYSPQRSAFRVGLLSWLPFLHRSATVPLAASSESLARFIQAALVERTRAVDRGIKSEQFYVIANAEHPAALVEGGFITNKSDVAKLATAEYRQQIAAAISDGVHRYREANRRGEATPTLAAAGPE